MAAGSGAASSRQPPKVIRQWLSRSIKSAGCAACMRERASCRFNQCQRAGCSMMGQMTSGSRSLLRLQLGQALSIIIIRQRLHDHCSLLEWRPRASLRRGLGAALAAEDFERIGVLSVEAGRRLADKLARAGRAERISPPARRRIECSRVSQLTMVFLDDFFFSFSFGRLARDKRSPFLSAPCLLMALARAPDLSIYLSIHLCGRPSAALLSRRPPR